MEFYLVRMSYEDLIGMQDWERAVGRHRGPPEDAPPPPPRKTAEVHVAVFPGWAGSPVARACDLAARRVLGENAEWKRWMPEILSVEYIGSGAVEEQPAALAGEGE